MQRAVRRQAGSYGMGAGAGLPAKRQLLMARMLAW